MQRRALLTQVLVVNACLAAAFAVLSVSIFGAEAATVPRLAALALLTGAVAAVVNLAFLGRRFGPLEALIEAMEKVDLSSVGSNIDQALVSEADSEEIERLELGFLRMMRRLEADRRRASSVALRAQERERARVARDLHDEVNQSLTGLLLRLEAVRSEATPELAVELDETKALANQAMRELLALARQLRPTALDDHGLAAALKGLGDQTEHASAAISFQVEAEHDGIQLEDLSDDAQLVIYRVAQEAIANAIRHSGAEQVTLRLVPRPSARPDVGGTGAGAVLEVSDNGRGFAFAESEEGLGLSGMRERALLAGGRLEIESRPGYGTSVELTL